MFSGEDTKYGQWVGTARHENRVEIRMMLNIEKRSPGLAQVCSHSVQFPQIRTIAEFQVPDFEGEVDVEIQNAQFYDPSTGVLIPAKRFWEMNQIHEPIPKRTHYVFHQKGAKLTGTFESDIGMRGAFELVNTCADAVSRAEHTLSWAEFKHFVANNYLNKDAMIFRGQSSNQHKLRTSFHRCNRNNLLAYLSNDVSQLRHAVNAISSFYYRENDGQALGALLSLAQHHGFPTPLLDWTLSPYIAAFFAFTESPRNSEGTAARIFIFDMLDWPREQSTNSIYDPFPSITFLMFPAHNNPRFVPQQSIASFSNIDDMEAFIRQVEQSAGRKHLTSIDIPWTERQTVIDELRLMGITAGSLFPGFDGVCRSLKERCFRE